MEPFLAMIMLWPVNFAPRGWAYCQGQLLAISQNTALFSLLGTTYGGNGQTNFALPDFRGRVPVGTGQGPGLSSYNLGQLGGTEAITLTTNQMPAHTHAISITVTMQASNAQATDSVPTATVNSLAAPYDTLNAAAIAGYNNQTPNTPLKGCSATGQITPTGGTQPFPILQPYLAVNYCIAMEGIYPSRP